MTRPFSFPLTAFFFFLKPEPGYRLVNCLPETHMIMSYCLPHHMMFKWLCRSERSQQRKCAPKWAGGMEVSVFTVMTLDAAFISLNLINIKAISRCVFAAKWKWVERERERAEEPWALSRSIATGSCTAQEKCAYIITCGPGILQRALQIAETQSGGGNKPTPGRTQQGAPTQLGFLTFLAASQRGQS